MKKQSYTIIGIKKASKENKPMVILKYTRNGKEQVTKRALYKNKENIHYILFKGITIQVKFNQAGIATDIKATGIYDEKVKEYDKNRMDTIELKIENKYAEPTEGIIESINVEALKEKAGIKDDPQGPVQHEKFEEIKVCVDNEIPVYLYGPAGSGKNHVLQQIAEELELEFYFTNSVQQEYKITGFIDAGGTYHETEFYKAFKNGGLFFLDEMDASIPEVLVLLNAALANGYFEFPNGKIDAHENFRVVAAGNTVGTGADEMYNGRLQLDQATLDRFAMIEFDYDERIELAISKGNKELVAFVRDLRVQAKRKGINATFSYRCITMVTKLQEALPLQKVIQMAVVKGLDVDTIKTFETMRDNKYSKSLWGLKQNIG